MYPITAKQMKAARAYLEWSQSDLASKTGLSRTTIRNLESGDLSPRCASARITAEAFKKAGVEFIEHEGIRCRPNSVTCYEGVDSRDRFFESLLESIREQGAEVYCAFSSLKVFLQCCKVTAGNADLFRKLNEAANVKCLLPQALDPALSIPFFKFRTVSHEAIGVESRFVYGNNHAIILTEDDGTLRFVVINSFNHAQIHKDHFLSIWEEAAPSLVRVANQERRAR